MKKDVWIIGFMLFALFFGAGNLIYPPTLGLESGTTYWAAIAGFIITGVGLPIMAVTAISTVKNGAAELADRVHPLFGAIFTAVVYLAIGPFFGIPRAATVAFEMSVEPFTSVSPFLLFLFTIIFFLLVYLVSINPSKMADRIGEFLTPLLLLAIVILCIGGILLLDGGTQNPASAYATAPSFTGFVEGYLTMDAIGGLAFGIIVIQAFNDRGVSSRKQLISATLKAGVIAGIGLSCVYAALGWIGTRMGTSETFANGGDILAAAADTMFGHFGTMLLGIIVALACFTTSVGLVAACAQFFHKRTPLSYKQIAAVVTIVSFLIANQGLNTIIRVSVPVLTFIYPIVIVLIALTFLNRLFGGAAYVYRGAILMTGVVSLYDGLIDFGISMPALTSMMEHLPFFASGIGWLVPALIGGIGGYVIQRNRTPSHSG
ncbi:branched-chain amino acid transport system II carrier protein [Lentibacillus halophilus]|uniref:Branched-chain amino acid transport system carrier protein n=1 Tax=Lentibacillus halophilus TaxID=295065 RepID=A0ABN0Z6F2_9BACI